VALFQRRCVDWGSTRDIAFSPQRRRLMHLTRALGVAAALLVGLSACGEDVSRPPPRLQAGAGGRHYAERRYRLSGALVDVRQAAQGRKGLRARRPAPPTPAAGACDQAEDGYNDLRSRPPNDPLLRRTPRRLSGLPAVPHHATPAEGALSVARTSSLLCSLPPLARQAWAARQASVSAAQARPSWPPPEVTSERPAPTINGWPRRWCRGQPTDI
jgi:hypothetical protein